MKDTVIKGNGKSRSIKAPTDMPETFEEWRTQLLAGTATLDIGLNAAGCEVVGTALTKANMLSDATKSALELTGSDPTVNDALLSSATLGFQNFRYIEFEESIIWKAPNNIFGNKIVALLSGGGGAGMKNGGGGGSGYITKQEVTIVPNQEYPIVIGAGAITSDTAQGGTTTAFGLSAAGGYSATDINGGNGNAGGGGFYQGNGGHGSTYGGGGGAGSSRNSTCVGGNGGMYGGGGGGSAAGGTGGTYGGNGAANNGSVQAEDGTQISSGMPLFYPARLKTDGKAGASYGCGGGGGYGGNGGKGYSGGGCGGGGGYGSNGGNGVNNYDRGAGGGGYGGNGGDANSYTDGSAGGGGGYFADGNSEKRGAGGGTATYGTNRGGNGIVAIWFVVTGGSENEI